ncbi:MAG: hypothetical protein JWL81_892, partial [Verrucomicrobiales bacterium]|nr:hypothetical protein [Verrucomicrobiales bacterium]
GEDMMLGEMAGGKDLRREGGMAEWREKKIRRREGEDAGLNGY